MKFVCRRFSRRLQSYQLVVQDREVLLVLVLVLVLVLLVLLVLALVLLVLVVVLWVQGSDKLLKVSR